MLNFTLYNPTKVYFGSEQSSNIKKEIAPESRILLTYGSNGIKKNGLYEKIKEALKDYTVIEFGGIEANPKYETLMRAVELAKQEKIDFILAVGGGSVIDGSKFIAAAFYFEGDPWDILAKQAPITKALPLGTVLTLAAAGSEMNCGAVISRNEPKEKLCFMHEKVFPRFSILEPNITFSVPANHKANGIVDIFVHVTEQYLTYPVDSPLQDRFAEAILQTLIEEAPKVIADSSDYNAHANIMWAGTMAINHILMAGTPEDWAAHMIGHEITALFGLAHGETLAIVMPAVTLYERSRKREKILQFAKRVWQIVRGSEEERIEQAIEKTREFFQSLGVKTKLSDYNINISDIPRITKQLEKHGLTALGENKNITPKNVEAILRACF